MRFPWRDILTEVIDVFFPSNCPVCSGPARTEDGYFSCPACLDQVSWVGSTPCKYCGIPMQAPEYEGLICYNCRQQDHLFKRGRCMFLLDQVGKQIIHSIKYKGSKEVLSDMPHWLKRVPQFKEFLSGAHLVPVPLHRKREASRGFNQSLWIAQALEKEMGSAVQVADWMKRTKNTETQTRLEKKKRKNNVKNAFALKAGVCLDSVNRIVLIDDVFTTGATLNACTEVWQDAGFDQVEVATLGHG